MSSSLKYRTLQLVQQCSLTDRQFATKFGVSIPWVRQFRNGEVKSPNVDLIQRIYEGLSGRQLFPEEKNNG